MINNKIFLFQSSLLNYVLSSFQAHEDGDYIKLVVKEECKDHVPSPVQRVLKSFHTEVSGFINISPLDSGLISYTVVYAPPYVSPEHKINILT